MLPRCLVFDLDGCVWDPEMYELWGGGGAPFKPNKDGTLSDKAGPSGFWLKRNVCLFQCVGSMKFFCLLLFKGTLHQFLKIKGHKEVTKQNEFMFFLLFFA
jgi:hypothetical protein